MFEIHKLLKIPLHRVITVNYCIATIYECTVVDSGVCQKRGGSQKDQSI